MVTATKPAESASLVVDGVEPSRLRLPPEWEFTDEAFHELCELNPEWRFEVDEQGRLVIMGGGGIPSSFRSFVVLGQLYNWWLRVLEGVVTTPDGFYRLDDRTIRAPDAAWVSAAQASQIVEDDEGFWRLCPDFVVEIRSPSDRLSRLQEKMQFWIDHGARLAWLIDPFGGIAYIYRPGREPEQLERPETLSGEDVLPELVVELSHVWRPAS